MMSIDTMFQPFDRKKHVYNNDALEEYMKDILRFVNGTPVQPLALLERFVGAGVYIIYYYGRSGIYKKLGDMNRTEYRAPIYIGKAVPKGWRQSRAALSSTNSELYSRLRQHNSSIIATDTLDENTFACRFAIFEGAAVGMIAAVEAKMIDFYRPVWNSCIDGFGNHDPGKGRYEQSISEWDTLHPGRPWTEKLVGPKLNRGDVLSKVMEYLQKWTV